MSDAFQFLAVWRGFAAMTLIICAAELAVAQSIPAASQTNAPIPFAELGARAGAQYQGNGLSVQSSREGARLRCDFQRLEGEATAEGLWLISTADGMKRDRFRIVARSVGRENESTVGRALARTGTVAVVEKLARFVRPGLVEEYSVSVDGVRQDFIIEQRPVGEGPLRVELDVVGAKVVADGARPVRYPEQVENAERGTLLSHGARLALENSGRTIAYNRLRVTDATGKELTARIEVMGRDGESQRDSIAQPRVANLRATLGQAQPQVTTLTGLRCAAHPDHQERCDATPMGLTDALRGDLVMNRNIQRPDSPLTPALSPLRGEGETSGVTGADDAASAGRAPTLAVVVEDADAVYPVRIDPMFSDENWISMGTLVGTNGDVYAAVVDGIGNLYIGGVFTVAGGAVANYVAKWDGSTWSPLGSGVQSEVHALAVSGSDLYAGGTFTTAGGSPANRIAKWDGSAWSALGSGLNWYVEALAVSGTNLYVGGGFTTAGGVQANRVAKWDGNTWSSLGSGLELGLGGGTAVRALAVSGTDLYAGGNFTMAGGSVVNHIAKWDGSAWSALGSGLSGGVEGVFALAVSGSDLYVGGDFSDAGGVSANNIAKWSVSESAWSPLGSGLSGGGLRGLVFTLAVSGSSLYVGGTFTTAGGSPAYQMAKWNGSAWSSEFGLALQGSVRAVAVSGTDLFIGGGFSTAFYIVKWDGNAFSYLGSGLNGVVTALAVSGTDLYVSGNFNRALGLPVNYIAKWNGSTWSALGSGLNFYASSLVVSGTDLYVGGDFTMAGGVSANNIAKWSISANEWSPLGSLLQVGSSTYPQVFALAVLGSDLYVGGIFRTADGSATNIAKWSVSANEWSPLGSGVSGYLGGLVFTLAVSGTDLYVGGIFRTADGSAANIAKWNGSAWSALGSGVSGGELGGVVSTLAVSGPDLYVGGNFTTAGDSAANNIAKWDGSAWSALGSGLLKTGGVGAIAVAGRDLYVGGAFTTAGGTLATNIARWDGSAWSALGSGVNNGGVSELAVVGSDLYVGGNFTTAGGKASAYLARANLAGGAAPALTLTRTSNNTVLVLWPSSFTNFTLQQNLDLNKTNWMTPSETVNSINSVNYIIVDPPSGNRFYRLFKP